MHLPSIIFPKSMSRMSLISIVTGVIGGVFAQVLLFELWGGGTSIIDDLLWATYGVGLLPSILVRVLAGATCGYWAYLRLRHRKLVIVIIGALLAGLLGGGIMSFCIALTLQ
jgi:hypothetical protein